MLSSIVDTGKDELSSTLPLPAAQFSYSTSTPGWTEDNNWTIPNYFVEGSNDFGTRLGDVNGDGLPDLLRAYSDVSGETRKIYMNDGDGTGWTEDTSWSLPIDFVSNTTDLGVRLVDVNGDGKIDLLKANQSGGGATTSQAFLNAGTGWATSTTWLPPVYFVTSEQDNGVRLADVNGDGLVDILISNNYDGTTIERKGYINNGAGWTENANWQPPVTYFVEHGEDFGTHLVDINADGLPDIVHSNNNDGINPSKRVFINNGNGWTEDTTWYTPVYFIENDSDRGVRLADVNGDGLTDLIQSHDDPSSPETKRVFLGTGSSWATTTAWSPPELFVNNNEDTGVRLDDLDGDGLIDFIRSYNPTSGGGIVKKVYLGNTSNPTDLLKQVTHATGAVTQVIYKGTPEYTSGGSLINKKLPLVLQTVREIGTYDGFGTWATTTYEYGGGEYYFNDSYNRRFASFATTTATNGLGYVTKTYAHQGNGTQLPLANTATTSPRLANPIAPRSTTDQITSTQKPLTPGKMLISVMIVTL